MHHLQRMLSSLWETLKTKHHVSAGAGTTRRVLSAVELSEFLDLPSLPRCAHYLCWHLAQQEYGNGAAARDNRRRGEYQHGAINLQLSSRVCKPRLPSISGVAPIPSLDKMPPPGPKSKPAPPPDYKTLASQFEAAKRAAAIETADANGNRNGNATAEDARRRQAERRHEAVQSRRRRAYEGRWCWTVGFWVWMTCVHVVGILYFTSGFLLTRLVLDERSSCIVNPLEEVEVGGDAKPRILPDWDGRGTVEGGCWYPRQFERAVVILIDALRYDFTIPVADEGKQIYQNNFPFLYETAVRSPQNAVLRPFIADPPTSTLQRLKGLTTGTLPTFIDIGSNFAGTAIEEDNLLMQLRDAGKKIVHLGDDTWQALFPGYFEPELSHAYDSFNVWDLHTVDNGVLEYIFPVLNRTSDWDLLIGHFLGVDHAGHRYGPDHREMARKLAQMDAFMRDLVQRIDDDTLLIVMGDHGMDGKGDHGGESDDEVEAALWMYSSRPFFGRTRPEFATPPATAKIRPTGQIDLVPTLALLLGLPTPYNNLGRPIEEAFAGPSGNAWDQLAAASRVTTAGIKRYQKSYFAARGIEQDSAADSPDDLWSRAEQIAEGAGSENKWRDAYDAFVKYQVETLRICKGLWARFDVGLMIQGLVITAGGVIALLLYACGDDDDDAAVLEDDELELAERMLELQGNASDHPTSTLHKTLVQSAGIGAVPGLVLGLALSWFSEGGLTWFQGLGGATLTSTIAVLYGLGLAGRQLRNLLPGSLWSWLAVIFTVSQSIGFASNSYTVWEDQILLFFLATFGFVAALRSLRLPTRSERYLAVYHALVFVVLGRIASFSKLCREEQMPYCTSTYYSSATSSTSAPWQLLIPFAVFLLLPPIIKSFLTPTRSYEGLAPLWIGLVFRTALFLSALFWVLDAADNGNWFIDNTSSTSTSDATGTDPEGVSPLKSIRVYIAQAILGVAFAAGTTAFIWGPPNIGIETTAATAISPRAQVKILGYGNAHGARWLLLLTNFVGACILLTKPMGAGSLTLMTWQILSLAELSDYLSLGTSSVGPVMLAILGNFHFFKTGHQASLASIQWDSAFIPLTTIRYPWSPLAVALNTFAGQILACVALPLLVLWKTSPKRRGILDGVSRALATFVAYFAVEALATMAWAGHLRRHLMLYRVFNPRFMMAAMLLLVVDLVGIVVALLGLRSNTLAISEVFGWVE
jgi:GPI ethanolamine phosphate transferase 3 subunit O